MYKDIFIKNKDSIKYVLKILSEIYSVVYIINKNGTYIGQSVINDYNSVKYNVPKKFVGKTIWDLFPKKEADIYFDFALESMSQNKSLEKYSTYSSKGDIYTDLFYNEPLRDNQGNIIGVVGKIIDVSSLKNTTTSQQYLEKITNKNTVIEYYLNDEFSVTFNKIVFLIKRLEINVNNNNDNYLLIKEIKILLKTLLYGSSNVRHSQQAY